MVVRVWVILGWILISSHVCMAYTQTIQDEGLVTSYAKGYAITADVQGPESVLKNPAALKHSTDRMFVMNMNNTFNSDLMTGFVAVAYKWYKNSTIGFSFPIQYCDNIPLTQESETGVGEQIDTFSFAATQPRLSVSIPIHQRVRVGTSLVGFYDHIYNETGTGYGVDVGAIVSLPYVTTGISFQNIYSSKSWTTGIDEDLDQIMNIGLKTQSYNGVSLSSDLTQSIDHTIINVGGSFEVNSMLTLHSGLRDLTEIGSFRFGADIRIQQLSIHYAFGTHTELDTTHKIGVSVDY